MAEKKEHTSEEIAQFTARQQMIDAYAKVAKQSLQLLDLTKNSAKPYTVYSKENLRSYLKNPLSEANQKNLRNVSQFLYHLSFQLRRIIAYYASQIDLSAYSVVPIVSMTEKLSDDEILKNYEQVLIWLERMNMPKAIYDPLLVAFREDAAFYYVYYDDKAELGSNSFVLVPMDGNYCKISSVNYDGTFNYAFDFSFFNGSNSIYLEYWDKEFQKKYNAYQKDNKLRWQELDLNRTFCIKVNSDQSDRIIPPLSSLYESIIDIIDLQGITNVKDALSIYKLLVANIGTISGSKEPDNFEIDLNTAIDFYNKINAALPDEVGIILSPMKIEPIEFNKNAASDTNEISNSMSNLWESAGVSQILDSKRLTGATAVRTSTIADGLMAIKPVLPQIEAWVNRFLNFVLPNNGMKVKYLPVTPYTKDEYIKTMKEAATVGVPVKMQYAALLGISPLEAFSMAYMENNILDINNKWIPLQNSYTQSGNNNNVKPGKDMDDLTDSGIETKDKEKNEM